MTVVVSDASPLNYLVWIGCEHVLPKLYERILVPAVVLHELEESGAPEKVAEWTTHLPEWINVSTDHPDTKTADVYGLDGLDPGERHAILLAINEHADLLLMDERAGVRVAREHGLTVTGTLGILLQASERGLLDMDAALRDLQATAFRCTPALIEEIRRRAGNAGLSR